MIYNQSSFDPWPIPDESVQAMGKTCYDKTKGKEHLYQKQFLFLIGGNEIREETLD